MRIGQAWVGALVMVLAGTAGAEAGNWSVFTRYFHEGPTYGCHPHLGWQDCMMPWQPVTSVMHYNVLPPGMHRPLPLYRPTPWLAPPTPDFTAAGLRAAGQRSKGVPCQNPNSYAPIGCSRYHQKPWWHHLAGWKDKSKSACACAACSGAQPATAAAPTAAPTEVPVDAPVDAPVEPTLASFGVAEAPRAIHAEADPYDGHSFRRPTRSIVAPAPLPPPVESQQWLR